LETKATSYTQAAKTERQGNVDSVLAEVVIRQKTIGILKVTQRRICYCWQSSMYVTLS